MENIQKRLLEIQVQIKMLHWHTKSYARHQAFGSFYSTMDEHIDEFIEILMGKYGRQAFNGNPENLEVYNLKDIKIAEFLDSCEKFFVEEITEALDAEKDTDLLNIRDEMLGALNKLKYLLTLE